MTTLSDGDREVRTALNHASWVPRWTGRQRRGYLGTHPGGVVYERAGVVVTRASLALPYGFATQPPGPGAPPRVVHRVSAVLLAWRAGRCAGAVVHWRCGGCSPSFQLLAGVPAGRHEHLACAVRGGGGERDPQRDPT